MSAAGSRVRVVIADDHPFFRDGVRRGLARDGRVEVVAEAEDGREALEAIRAERPDVAFSLPMPALDGLAIVAPSSATAPARVLLLSAHTESSRCSSAAGGAAGCLPKDARRSRSSAVLRWSRGDGGPEHARGQAGGRIRPGPSPRGRPLGRAAGAAGVLAAVDPGRRGLMIGVSR
jgi:two-component system nitrate/nitrite response regulator NarL